MNCNLLNRGYLILVATMVVFVMMTAPIYAAEKIGDLDMAAHDYILDRQQSFNCSMVQMNDDELSEVTAAGFSSFNLQDNMTRAYFNVEASTFTEIQSLKMGYYNDGITTGWDEDWTGVSLGSSTESLTCKGLYIEASFSNIANSSTRTLNSIKVGTPAMTGPISAAFNSFSGRIEDGTGMPVIVGGQSIDGHRITTLGTKTIYSNNDEFSLQLSGSGAQKGWWVFWKNATVN
jgi:hypothetical protein